MSRSDCIPFDGPRRADGYGREHVNGSRFYAHRVAYCRENNVTLDEIKGKVVRHDCDNPSCVNALHLSLGTSKDNVDDKIKRGRAVIHEEHPMRKLTWVEISAIRRDFDGQRGQRTSMARKYGVSPALIWKIVNYKIWKVVSPIHAPMMTV